MSIDEDIHGSRSVKSPNRHSPSDIRSRKKYKSFVEAVSHTELKPKVQTWVASDQLSDRQVKASGIMSRTLKDMIGTRRDMVSPQKTVDTSMKGNMKFKQTNLSNNGNINININIQSEELKKLKSGPDKRDSKKPSILSSITQRNEAVKLDFSSRFERSSLEATFKSTAEGKLKSLNQRLLLEKGKRNLKASRDRSNLI